ncbi:MAG: leucine--tRNA ligase [Candidatus Aenigmarchaeota archaeon]|nr:leucine--tRNA ligase [Candidatus Aenigmarchaeota archaeon]
MLEFREIEKKWQMEWEAAKAFETNIDDRKKFFTSLVIAYVNGNAHVGHSFTFTRNDVYARFKRMQGYNTLLAQGFHATGEPILGTVERLRKNDQSQIDTFKLYGADDDDLKLFKEHGPEFVAKYWMNRIILTMKSMGYSIDWRRRFVTAIDPCFNRFIEWQYNSLRKKGYVIQGTHPVVWCSHDQSPTGDHDRLRGEGESPVEYTVIKFTLEDDTGHRFIFPCATLRPETVYGVTNIWLKPNTEYVLAEVNNEMWILSREAVEKLTDQLFHVEERGIVHSEDFFGKLCKNPITKQFVPILPLKYVDVSTGTGVVMSVPSHAPHDWVGIKEVLADEEKKKRYNVNSTMLKPIDVVAAEGLDEMPAVAMVEAKKITSSSDPRLEAMTAELYKKEFHTGRLMNNCGDYAGQKVSEIKEHLVQKFKNTGIAAGLWEITDKVVCRCSTECHVKILENQWFLNYSNDKWKSQVKQHLETMRLYPEIVREQFENTIDWLKDKACARKSGLGTKLPWDKEWIVETLSDSTVYMAYYTIAKTVNENNIPATQLIDDVFDFVFAGKGAIESVAKKSGLDETTLKEMKNEFEYFYPVDIRMSAKELVQNHLIFYIYHHVALFKEQHWPKAISINGYVNVHGQKMSKSKGNVLPLIDLIERHGADLVRLNIVSSAEGMDDADWREENINPIKNRLVFLHSLLDKKCIEKNDMDQWLEIQMHKMIKQTTMAYAETKFRTALYHCLFNAVNDIKWYLKRTDNPSNALPKFIENTIKLLAPAAPHFCEEMWNRLGNKSLISLEQWPEYEDVKIIKGESIEKQEEFIRKTLDDIEQIKHLAKKQKPSKIILIIAKSEKFAEKKEKKDQMAFLENSGYFLKKELGAEIEILDSDVITDKHDLIYQKKSESAKPEKPGVVIY